MPLIQLTTFIDAPIELVFDLSRSVDVHILSTSQTNETAVAGRTSGLCEIGDTITWRAKHFGLYQKLSVEIVACNFPHYFEDHMTKGAFNHFTHKHFFSKDQTGAVMRDEFDFSSPLGILGNIADWLFLKNYMTNLLTKRNQTIKEYAEGPDGKKFSRQ